MCVQGLYAPANVEVGGLQERREGGNAFLALKLAPLSFGLLGPEVLSNVLGYAANVSHCSPLGCSQFKNVSVGWITVGGLVSNEKQPAD